MSNTVGPEVSLRIVNPRARHTSSPRRLALAVAVLFGLTSVVAFASPARTFAWDTESFSSASEADLVALTNRSRANAGLRSLRVDSALTSVARWRSKDMIQRDYFSHTIPGYGKVWDKLKAVGYCYKLAGENIGWNNYPDDIATGAIHQMFMDSAGHRENIMGKAWDRIGVGAYKGPTGKKMWTVIFADKCGTTATPKPTAKPTPKPTAKPAAKPAPRATPKPTPRPAPRKTASPQKAAATPAPTPEVVETPVPLSTAPLDEGDLLPSDEPEPADDDGSTDSSATPSQEPLDETEGDGAVGMRVVDDGETDGLLESIVGDVAGLFFGG